MNLLSSRLTLLKTIEELIMAQISKYLNKVTINV